MTWTCDTGSVVMTDLRRSTDCVLALERPGEVERFFNGLFEEYRGRLFAVIARSGSERWVGATTSTGDGFALPVARPAAAAELAWSLQRVADEFADDVCTRLPRLGGYELRAESFHFGTGIGAATGLMLRRTPADGRTVELTGPVFNLAARIGDKAARDRRAVLSPLLDEDTVRRARRNRRVASRLRFFATGAYALDVKAQQEGLVERGDPLAGIRVYSVVERGSPLEPAAVLLEQAIQHHYEFRRVRARETLRRLAALLDGRAHEIEADVGREAATRWRQALRRFSYAF